MIQLQTWPVYILDLYQLNNLSDNLARGSKYTHRNVNIQTENVSVRLTKFHDILFRNGAPWKYKTTYILFHFETKPQTHSSLYINQKIQIFNNFKYSNFHILNFTQKIQFETFSCVSEGFQIYSKTIYWVRSGWFNDSRKKKYFCSSCLWVFR